MAAIDLHTQLLLDEYNAARPVLERLLQIVLNTLQVELDKTGLYVTTVQGRVKTLESLAGKLERKGNKYNALSDITDLVGARVVTFYTDDVDRIAAMAEKLFDIDWENSVDKRRLHQLDSFGYNSLHYICRLPKTIVDDPDCPQLNTLRFELQLRTTLQHAWAAANHDTGYKSGVEIPREYMRQMNRLAGLLEMADDEFSRIRTELNDYRRRMQNLVSNGKLDDVPLDGETFRSFLETRPFDQLNKRIAAINQAEVFETSLMPYLAVLKAFDFQTLGDVAKMMAECENDAYRLARHQLGTTDLDIVSSAISLQNICIVYILCHGGGKAGLRRLYDWLNGANPQNEQLAELTYKQAAALPFMQ